MTEGTPGSTGWFETLEPDDVGAAADAIQSGSAEDPRDWPTIAIETGFVTDDAEYYDRLHEAAIEATKQAVQERETAPDRQLVHAVRAMDDIAEMSNELTERLAEWAGSKIGEDGAGLEYVRNIASRTPDDTTEERVIALADRITNLAAEEAALRDFIETEAPSIAPNLSAMAGPILAARLISLAGSLESLAKKSSGTIQVLGAEDALFAHLEGHATSPKHGVIYTHEYVRETATDRRGSAARALAGKLAIAARIDHYSGERKPEIDAELKDRIETIRSGGDH